MQESRIKNVCSTCRRRSSIQSNLARHDAEERKEEENNEADLAADRLTCLPAFCIHCSQSVLNSLSLSRPSCWPWIRSHGALVHAHALEGILIASTVTTRLPPQPNTPRHAAHELSAHAPNALHQLHADSLLLIHVCEFHCTSQWRI